MVTGTFCVEVVGCNDQLDFHNPKISSPFFVYINEFISNGPDKSKAVIYVMIGSEILMALDSVIMARIICKDYLKL